MRTSAKWFFELSVIAAVLFGLLGVSAGSARADDKAAAAKVDPEIVRLSFIQGDVRFSRGDAKGPNLEKDWEQGAVNLPILKNYSLATGNGRAEIEFEYGSVVYLAENSVLLFDTASVTNGVPTTELELISGTATFSMHAIAGERFQLATATDRVVFPGTSYMRVDSYLDAIALTPQVNGNMSATAGLVKMVKGQPNFYRNGLAIQPGATDQSGTPGDWDAWVDARVKQRDADTAAALKASGLPGFIPGLTDMYKGGTFFACPPYGTCWEPKELPAAKAAAGGAAASGQTNPVSTTSGNFALAAFHGDARQVGSQQSGAQQSGTQQSGTSGSPTAPGTDSTQAVVLPPRKPIFSEYYEPLGDCPVTELDTTVQTDPVTGKETIVDQTIVAGPAVGEPIWWPRDPWTWGLCHSGFWAHVPRRGTRFTFIVGRKHHHPPVHWMHGKKEGDVYVPAHPSDVKGQTPLNLKYGIFKAKNGPTGPVQRIDFNPKETYTVLTEAPKEFRDVKYPERVAAQRPEIQGRLVAGAKVAPGTGGKSDISYDYKSRSFVRAGAPVGGHAGKPVVVARGGFSTGGSGRPSGGASGRPSGGGTGHASGGGGSGGSGSHSGGGGGGGGAHGGGGGSHGGGGGGGGGHTGRG
jgi:FecR protein